MQSIEFATGDDDDEATELALSQNGTAGKGKGETLEQLLLARNKKLSNELTVLRVSHQDLQTRLEALQEELSNTNMELEKSKALNETLEADLEKVQQEASNAFDPSGMSVAGTYVSTPPILCPPRPLITHLLDHIRLRQQFTKPTCGAPSW
jgi:homeobox protein cut-like